MNLKNLFKHKLLEERTKPDDLGGLVYAIRYENHPHLSGIFLHTDGKEDILLGERWHTVSDLCVQNNWLYDSGCKRQENLGFVIDTITGRDVCPRTKQVFSITSHKGRLYAACSDDRGWYVFDVFTSEMIASRHGQITALCSHEGVLYDGGYYEGLYDTFKNEKVNKKCCVYRLCSSKEKMYGLSIEHVKYYFNGVIFDALTNKEVTKIKQEHINAICWHNGKVFYAYSDVMIDVARAELLHHNKKGMITAICSIPKELKEQIIHNKNYGFSLNETQQINPKGAIEYLTNISDSQERRRVIEQLFNCDDINEEVLNWLNEHEQDTMRKAAFY